MIKYQLQFNFNPPEESPKGNLWTNPPDPGTWLEGFKGIVIDTIPTILDAPPLDYNITGTEESSANFFQLLQPPHYGIIVKITSQAIMKFMDTYGGPVSFPVLGGYTPGMENQIPSMSTWQTVGELVKLYTDIAIPDIAFEKYDPNLQVSVYAESHIDIYCIRILSVGTQYPGLFALSEGQEFPSITIGSNDINGGPL